MGGGGTGIGAGINGYIGGGIGNGINGYIGDIGGGPLTSTTQPQRVQ